MDDVRINKYIASTGYCSRRKAEEYILAGKVKINGSIVSELGTKVCPGDEVSIDGKLLETQSKQIYIMLNKPAGYITTSKEQFGRPTVLDIVKTNERIFPVGRLDMFSEGLILLTNDGDFTNKIIHPTNYISKTYVVTLKEPMSEISINKLECGVDIGGYVTKPAKVKTVGEKKIEITIYEGKNRQVRKMCEAVGNKVVALKRIAIGKLLLGRLKCGQYIELSKKEIEKIFE